MRTPGIFKCGPSTPNFRIKSATVYLPWCGFQCGSFQSGVGPVYPSCANDQTDLCFNNQFLELDYACLASWFQGLASGHSGADGCTSGQAVCGYGQNGSVTINQSTCVASYSLTGTTPATNCSSTFIPQISTGDPTTPASSSNPCGLYQPPYNGVYGTGPCPSLCSCFNGDGVSPGQVISTSASPAALSSETTIPSAAQAILDTLSSTLSSLEWGKHIVVYPKIDAPSTAAGDCPASWNPSVNGNSICFLSATASTTYTYSENTIPSWVNGGSDGEGGFVFSARNGPILEPTALGTGCSSASPCWGDIDFGYPDPPGFPDGTYGNPYNGFYIAQIIMVESIGCPVCGTSAGIDVIPGICSGSYPSVSKFTLPCTNSSVTDITLRPTFIGNSITHLAGNACPPYCNCIEKFNCATADGGQWNSLGCCP